MDIWGGVNIRLLRKKCLILKDNDHRSIYAIKIMIWEKSTISRILTYYEQ